MGKKDNGKSVSGGGGGLGKNGKDGKVVASSNVPNRDIMQRMNFLWQASVYFERLGSGSGDLGGGISGTSTKSGGDNEGELSQEKKGRKRRPRRTKKVDGCDLARMHVRTMNVVGQRTTTKIDPGVKRALCRGCSSVLVPGISTRIRTRPSRQHEHRMVYTCLKCGTSRRLPAPGNRVIDSPHPPSGVELSATTTRNIDTPMERLGEEQQRLAQSSNEPHSHPVQQQQLRRHSGGEGHLEKHVGDKKGITNDAQMDVLGDQRDHSSQRNIVVPRKQTKSVSKQKKTRKKQKKASTLPPPITRQPPLFARKDVGHVVYRGGEIIDMEGVYCV